MITRKLRLVALSSGLVPVLFTWAAWAKDIDRKEAEARMACLAGEYAKGVAILSELFVQTKIPDFIYNQGRCFEQNHRYEDAIARFREFLRVDKKISKSDRANAEKHIADCQHLLEEQPAATKTIPTEKASYEVRERSAKRACLTGDPTEGVAILTDLYLDTKDPTHLFNQGRCFEQNRRYEDAVGRFREYLVKAKNLSQADKTDTEQHIASCESYLQDQPTRLAGTPPKTAEDSHTTEGASVLDKKQLDVSMPPVKDTGEAGRGLRITGGGLVVAGVTGLAVGALLNLKANSMSSDLNNDWNPALNATRGTYKTAAWIGYTAGAVCSVAGAVLYYWGWRRETRAASIAVLPSIGRDMAGPLLRVFF